MTFNSTRAIITKLCYIQYCIRVCLDKRARLALWVNHFGLVLPEGRGARASQLQDTLIRVYAICYIAFLLALKGRAKLSII